MINSTAGSFYHRCIAALIAAEGTINIVQVGANDGKINDPIYETVIGNIAKTNILLIEPQQELIPYLKRNYGEHPGARIWNGAIGPEGTLSLYRIKPCYWERYIKRYLMDAPAYRVPSGFASSSRLHVLNHARGNLPAGIRLEQAIEEIRIESRNLVSVIKKSFQDFMRVDVLQIDAEGMDHVVLQNSNIEVITPALINFEHAHLRHEDYSGARDYLERLGYKLFRWADDDTLAIRGGLIDPAS